MTMTVETYSHHHEPNVLARAWDWLVSLGHAFVEARQMQARYEALSSLSDQQLADVGLARGDVPRAAFSRRPFL